MKFITEVWHPNGGVHLDTLCVCYLTLVFPTIVDSIAVGEEAS